MTAATIRQRLPLSRKLDQTAASCGGLEPMLERVVVGGRPRGTRDVEIRPWPVPGRHAAQRLNTFQATVVLPMPGGPEMHQHR